MTVWWTPLPVSGLAGRNEEVDQQFADRIFGLFQRLHGREVEGTGMGLTIAKRIVDRHGGRIWAEGKEGGGATFFFSLPVSLESRAETSDTTSAAGASAGAVAP